MNKFKIGDKVKDTEGNLLTIDEIVTQRNPITLDTYIYYHTQEHAHKLYLEANLTLYEEPKTGLTNEEFLEKAKQLVRDYAKENAEEEDFEVYIVWSCKILQHSKALLSTTIPDTRYYEVTYNGIKNEIYFDAYTKEVNRLVEVK